MDELFYYSALIGGTVLVVQTLMLLIGIGGDEFDADFDADVDVPDTDAAHLGMVKILSVKALVAFFTFFGLTGMLARESELDLPSSGLLAVAAGVASMFLVAWLLASLTKLHSRGNLDFGQAQGSTGTVYLRVHAGGESGGRVTVEVQGRRVECRAITHGEEIAVGTPIVVVGLANSNTLEVRPAVSPSQAGD
ncbi:MAG: hypothetical protein AAF196_06355 [Planctomycetota bacterium]